MGCTACSPRPAPELTFLGTEAPASWTALCCNQTCASKVAQVAVGFSSPLFLKLYASLELEQGPLAREHTATHSGHLGETAESIQARHVVGDIHLTQSGQQKEESSLETNSVHKGGKTQRQQGKKSRHVVYLIGQFSLELN
eukprot:1160962-Pelagomonas_calceolata.AAC.15